MKPGNSHKKAFILFPILFFTIGYLLLYLALLPVLGTAASAADLVFFSNNHQPDKQMGNIFTSAPETNAKTVKKSQIIFPEYGTKFGRLIISSASLKADLYFGDGTQELKNGVGLYNGSFIPGYGRTILIAGHNHTYFHTLGSAKIGDSIEIETNYGKYEYRITKSQVKPSSDKTAYDLSDESENLILYTCYPFDCIGLTPQRYYVYAQFVSGPIIDKQG